MDEHLAILGHDLRNELSAITGLADIIEFVSKDPEIRECTRQIRNHNQFMFELANAMVVSAKAGSGAPTLSPMSFWNMIADLTAGLTIGPDRPPVALTAVGMIPEKVMGDGLMLRQIFTNLVGNAVRFTREGGVRVCLEYAGDAKAMHVTISDTGPGMTAEQLSRLFRPDWNIHREGASPGGHGLGLWIARRLIDQLGGDIKVCSMVGHGTVIAVGIPCAVVEGARMVSEADLRQAMTAAGSVGMTAKGRLAGLRILVADDVPANRLIAATLLKRRGASVTLANDGVEAVRLAQAAQDGGRPFDVMLFDFHMPNMDGAQAAEVLRSKGCVAPILCWTASSSPTLNNLSKVFTSVLDKPVETERFYAVVEKHSSQAGRKPLRGSSEAG